MCCECERWQSACRSAGTGLRAGVLLRPAAVPAHTAALCQPCPPFDPSHRHHLSLSLHLSLCLSLSLHFPSQFISCPSPIVFPFLPFFRFHSPLLPLLPNELNPTAPMISFSICVSCLCPNLAKCPDDILWILSYPQGTLVLLLLYDFIINTSVMLSLIPGGEVFKKFLLHW